jgi:hypothetical protein
LEAALGVLTGTLAAVDDNTPKGRGLGATFGGGEGECAGAGKMKTSYNPTT